MEGIGKSRSKERGPDEQENANKAGDFWSGSHCYIDICDWLRSTYSTRGEGSGMM
jgi:hypothetical protein